MNFAPEVGTSWRTHRNRAETREPSDRIALTWPRSCNFIAKSSSAVTMRCRRRSPRSYGAPVLGSSESTPPPIFSVRGAPRPRCRLCRPQRRRQSRNRPIGKAIQPQRPGGCPVGQRRVASEGGHRQRSRGDSGRRRTRDPSLVEAVLSRNAHQFDTAGIEFVVWGAEAPYEATLREIYADLAPVAVIHGRNAPTPARWWRVRDVICRSTPATGLP